MKHFNVINYDINAKVFEPYDIIPHLVECYNKKKNKPVTFEEFREFVKNESMYQWWSRCEYEIILSPWPYITSPSESYHKEKENDIEAWKEHWKKHLKECDKWDIHMQVMMNIDVITNLVMESV